MSDKKALDLNQLASMTAKDFRAMEISELTELAISVTKNFPGLTISKLNPAFDEVFKDVEKEEKASVEKLIEDGLAPAWKRLKESPLGTVYVGIRVEFRETEAGTTQFISYLTTERTTRNAVKAQPTPGKVLAI
jgi:hypothetical protein